ncbi:sensor histidine kinase [Actinophytocola sp.]|uniref:sensor histidine kinase n=1 Tax=Actinophytocola sp. TaxID=1872138 RepID=UPI002ED4FD08
MSGAPPSRLYGPERPQREPAVTLRGFGLGVIVFGVFVLGTLDLVEHYNTGPLSAYALSAARAAPLLLCRRLPIEAWVIELSVVLATAIVAAPVTPDEPWPWAASSVGAVALVAGLVAARGARQLSIVMLAVMTTLGLLLALWPGRGDWTSVLTATVVCAIGAILGDFVNGRQRMVVELEEERQVSATERELRSVVEERARIARELHDVVAHHMSMITVQAETARYRHQGLPDAAVAEFTEIASVARRSLSELRGLLSALRDDGADPSRTPQPTLADLPSLVARINTAGTPVTLDLPPNTTDLPPVVQLALYRTAQEALSNVVRHAGGAPTRVEVTRTDDKVSIEVTNEPPPDPRPGRDSAGQGLVGLRERTVLLGGRFEVDQPDGGWRVRAELPL